MNDGFSSGSSDESGDIGDIVSDLNIQEGGVTRTSSTTSNSTLSNSSLSNVGSLENDVVTARGTSKGLVVRISLAHDPLAVQAAVREFLISRSGFLKGSEVFLDWAGLDPEASGRKLSELEQLKSQLRVLMERDFAVKPLEIPQVLVHETTGNEQEQHKSLQQKRAISSSLSGGQLGTSKQQGSRKIVIKESIQKMSGSGRERDGFEDDQVLSLFDGIDDNEVFTEDDLFAADESLGAISPVGTSGELNNPIRDARSEAINRRSPNQTSVQAGASGVQGELPYDDVLLDGFSVDEADCRVIVGTLRSGQKIESEHSLLVIGDVNSGAELVAGGDIIVLGKLRGVAHAGAYDETGGGKVIVALDLAPTQLRIGSVITRGNQAALIGSSSSANNLKSTDAELARVEGNMIVVEKYNSRARLR